MKRVIPFVAALMVAAGVAAEPPAHRFEIGLDDHFGFIRPTSHVRVRENNVPGEKISFHDLGLKTANIPSLRFQLWMTNRDFLRLTLRDFLMKGSVNLDHDAIFNGSTMAAGQTLTTKPKWYSVGLFYGHRWTPDWMAGWGLTGLAGLEYTSIDFEINGGHAVVTPTSANTETRETYQNQELPLPEIGVAVDGRLSPNAVLEASLRGGWINKWNTGRKEGGTVYLTQGQAEGHLRVRASNDGAFRRFQPMIGLFFHAFRLDERSGEDGNTIAFVAWGPEIGVTARF